MGYYTVHNLDIPGNELSVEEVAAKLAETYNDLDTRYWLSAITGEDVAKWYGHPEDMREISKHWPDILFTLSGVGEETGDVWAEYYLGGKVHREFQPEWVPPPFDPRQLV